MTAGTNNDDIQQKYKTKENSLPFPSVFLHLPLDDKDKIKTNYSDLCSKTQSFILRKFLPSSLALIP